MKRITIGISFVLSVLCMSCIATHYSQLSRTQVSLLTVAPGKKFYSVFGHSAIRISIDSLNYDMVYNFGMYTPSSDLYFNWLRGRMLFHMSIESYSKFLANCENEKRSVREQVLDMDSVQTMFIINSLEKKYYSDKRYYWYHIFHDNCATRIRELILQTYDSITFPQSQGTLTYRDLLHPYLKEYPWGRFIIDIASGLPFDQKTGIYEQMFLPDNVSDVFASALSHRQPIVKETKNVFVPGKSSITPSLPITPIFVCCFILAVALLFSYIRKGSKVFDFVFFFTVGMVGMLIIYLWFFSDHTTAANNLNIIWALPTHMVMAFSLLSNRNNNFTCKYFLVTTIVAVFLIISWIFLPQQLNPALIPLVVAIALRGWRIYSNGRCTNLAEVVNKI